MIILIILNYCSEFLTSYYTAKFVTMMRMDKYISIKEYKILITINNIVCYVEASIQLDGRLFYEKLFDEKLCYTAR